MHLTLHDRVQMLKSDMENGVLVRAEDMCALVYDLWDYKRAEEALDKAPSFLETLKQTEGIKHDTTKPDFSLLSPLAITYLVSVLDKGKVKYAAHNWRNGIDQTRLISAAMRHLFAFLSGQDTDPETKLPHMAHVMCCAMFSIELQLSAKDKDTRYPLSREQLDLLESMLAGVVQEQ